MLERRRRRLHHRMERPCLRCWKSTGHASPVGSSLAVVLVWVQRFLVLTRTVQYRFDHAAKQGLTEARTKLIRF